MTKPKPKTEKKPAAKPVANKNKPQIGKETMTGDLRDAILQIIRTQQKPWQQLSEKEQRAVVDNVTKRAEAIATEAVRVIASDGRKVLEGQLEQITVKDGLKAIITLSKTHRQRHEFIDTCGKGVLIVVDDPEGYRGERAPAEIDKDQKALPLGDKPVADSGKNIPQNRDKQVKKPEAPAGTKLTADQAVDLAKAKKQKKGEAMEKLKDDTEKETSAKKD